jgi:elongation factor Ts
MANITAQMVKALRDQTGAGMMDCKAALAETAGETTAAIDWLRAKGLAKAAKKSGRVAAEGLVGVALGPKSGALVEVNAETDFVARNEQFQDLVQTVARIALGKGGSLEETVRAAYPGADKAVGEHIAELVGTIGENMTLRRAAGLTVENGVVGAYVHNAVAEGLGRIGVLVALESAADSEPLAALARQIAMHVAAASPLALSVDQLDPKVVARERQVLSEQARESGRPDNIIDKMVEGRMRKFYEDVVLTAQTYVIDGERTVGKAVEDAARELGQAVAVTGFVRMALGEGVEREESNFAAEVAAAAGS